MFIYYIAYIFRRCSTCSSYPWNILSCLRRKSSKALESDASRCGQLSVSSPLVNLQRYVSHSECAQAVSTAYKKDVFVWVCMQFHPTAECYTQDREQTRTTRWRTLVMALTYQGGPSKPTLSPTRLYIISKSLWWEEQNTIGSCICICIWEKNLLPPVTLSLRYVSRGSHNGQPSLEKMGNGC